MSSGCLLLMPGLIRCARASFSAIQDPVKARRYALVDCLICAFAMFSLKDLSLLEFLEATRGGRNPVAMANLRTLFKVKDVPSPSGFRQRLDPINPRRLRGACKAIGILLQRGKVLEAFKVRDGHVLIALDGTGPFASTCLHGDHGLTRKPGDGTITTRHQMPGAARVPARITTVIPLAPELITRWGGAAPGMTVSATLPTAGSGLSARTTRI